MFISTRYKKKITNLTTVGITSRRYAIDVGDDVYYDIHKNL